MNGITPATLLAIAAAIALPVCLLALVLLGRSTRRDDTTPHAHDPVHGDAVDADAFAPDRRPHVPAADVAASERRPRPPGRTAGGGSTPP